ncbi:predicted protein [Sclerotinia sclerotiorum 1980 UF-70]|uniref:Uncharacterized protein n=1 Tax=Sclerotinia sclerotiorum (strain ATCC 18683 / 1980 / Ss-1) TaxID=665079 RepID=A7ENN8_SCLS1|nr:predicted protein [Sclerotinia sclerotiorum 1980 UF-70]EDO04454.1 predicted protein [Sclerotinia sclerotiorum 1980 UF-70]
MYKIFTKVRITFSDISSSPFHHHNYRLDYCMLKKIVVLGPRSIYPSNPPSRFGHKSCK